MRSQRLFFSLAILCTCCPGYCQAHGGALKPQKSTVKKKAPAAPEPSLEDSISQLDLAKAIVDEADCVNVCYEQSLINTVEGSYSHGPINGLTEGKDILEEDNRTLSDTEFDDSAMEAARKDLLGRMAILLKDMAEMESAIMRAQLAGGWTDQAASSSAAAQKESVEIKGNGSVEALIKKRSFQEQLPNYYLETNGLIPDPAGFKFGVLTTISDSLYVIYVDPNGLAAKLKLTDLERVLEFNGNKPRNMDDLKLMIKKAAGQDVTIRVETVYGEDADIETTVPVKLNP